MKQQIEIDVPDGMLISSVSQSNGSSVISVVVTFESEPPKTKRRPPTKHDLLGVDSLSCWVRNFETEPWLPDRLVAVGVTDGTVFYGANNGWCRYCEIEVPADEKPLREAWVDYHAEKADPWGASWPMSKKPVHRSTIEVIHMIEVRP